MVQWLRLCSQCRGPGFDPWLGNNIPHATVKTQQSQIIIKKKKKAQRKKYEKKDVAPEV